MEFKKKYIKADALSNVRNGEYDQAIAKYKEYLQLNRADGDAWAGLGGAYRRKGNLDKAIESYEKAFRLDQNSTYALVNIISLRAARNNEADKIKIQYEIDTAEGLTRRIIDDSKGDHWTWYDLATLQLLDGKVSEAISAFNFAAELTPKTSKENFKSVLNNLEFLQKYNPQIEGLADAVAIIKQYAEQTI